MTPVGGCWGDFAGRYLGSRAAAVRGRGQLQEERFWLQSSGGGFWVAVSAEIREVMLFRKSCRGGERA